MKTLFKTLLIVAGIATMVAPQIIHTAKATTSSITERHEICTIIPQSKMINIKYIGGMPLVTEYYGNPFGMTPKEYGIRFGNGKSKKAKINKKHRSHLHRVIKNNKA